jgi:hypothetical protein
VSGVTSTADVAGQGPPLRLRANRKGRLPKSRFSALLQRHDPCAAAKAMMIGIAKQPVLERDLSVDKLTLGRMLSNMG